MISIILATTLLSSAVLASPPPVDTLSNGTLAPPHFDHGLDTDSDSEYNFLVVDVNVSVTVPGQFVVVADLIDPVGGSTIDSQFNMTMLGPGPQTVPVWFNGLVIRASGISGPYSVNIMLLNDSMMPEDFGVHFTGPYLWSQFETPTAQFWPPHLDFGEDLDADTYFDNLVLQTVLNVTQAGTYMVDGLMYDNSGMFMFTSANFFGPLGSGIQMVELRFNGFTIFSSGFDGPYKVELRVSDMTGFLDNDTHMTQAYLHTDFEQTGGAVLEPPYTDYGVDTDGDTLFDFLVVEIPLNVTESGNYFLNGQLYDGSGMNPIAFQGNMSFFNPGHVMMQLWFTGYLIRDSGFNGPYLLDIMLNDMMTMIDNDTYMTNSYLTTDFDPVPAQFAPPYSDYGVDPDADMLFDYLVVNVPLNVDSAGPFSVTGDMYDNSMMNYILTINNDTILGTGIQTVQLWFPGFAIRNSGYDGPYYINLYLSQGVNLLAMDSYFTNPYLYTDFETPPLSFTPPHSDHGLDTDGDMFYNYLVVDFNVTVNLSGAYQFQAQLTDLSGMTFIDMQFNDTSLGTGPQTVEIRFDGLLIRQSGVNGPYRVDVTAQQAMVIVASDTYITNPYLYTEFQRPPAEFGSPHSDHGLDTDAPPDGYFDFLVVDAIVNVYQAGEYLIEGYLQHPMIPSGLIAINYTHLDVGTQTVELRFSGKTIFISGADGTFNIMLMLGTLGPFGLQMIDMDSYTTGPYLHTDFQPSNPALLWGYVLEAGTGNPIPFANVIIFNFTEGSVVPTSADPTGYYSFDLHEGDYFVNADDSMHQAEGELVFASGSTEVTMNLGPVPPDMIATSLAFTDWDNAHTTSSMSLQADNQTFRPEIEIIVGNRDGQLNGSEIEKFFALMGGSLPSMPQSTMDMFYVDGIHYDLVPGSDSFQASDGGAVWDDAPLVFNMAGDYVSNTTIPVNPTHLLKVNVTYDTATEATEFHSNIPSNYHLQSYDPVQDVNVGGIGTSTIVVDPTTSPGAPLPYVWVNLTVQMTVDTAPEISNVLVDGQPSMTYYLSSLPQTIDLTAVIDDTFTGGQVIGGANYTTPTAVSWPGVQMVAADGTFDEQNEQVIGTFSCPSTPGTYTYYVHAWDINLNYNDTAPFATVTILDDLAPQVSLVRVDGQASVTVNTGTIVTLTATTSDLTRGGSNIAGVNYTIGLAQWPGTDMTAVDGAFNSPQEDATATVDTQGWSVGTYQVCVYAWDNALGRDDTVQACAQITIVNDNDPPAISLVSVDGHASVTVRPRTDVLLTATVSDVTTGGSTVAGANYTEGQGQWPGTAMAAADGAFDESLESVSVTIDTTGWTDGTHQLCVYGWDASGFRNTTAQECANIVIDGTPPSISQEAANPNPQETGKSIEISATVTDSGGISAIGVEVRDPGGTLLGNYTMVYNSGTQKYAYSGTYNTAGTYTFRIWARDMVGNYAHSSGTFDITQPATPPTTQPSFIEQYWWALLIVIVVVVALLAFMFMRKKKPGRVPEGEQAPPTGQPPEQTLPPPPPQAPAPPQPAPPPPLPPP